MTSIGTLEDGKPEHWEMGHGILCAMVGSIRFWVSLWEYAAASSAEDGDGGDGIRLRIGVERCPSNQREVDD